MLSSGGISGVETASRFPLRLLESGPAGGALASAYFGQQAAIADLLAFDMGGTTAKLCVIENGQPLTSTEFEVDRKYRFKTGSGLPVKTPVVDLIEIGAGGGSIARVDSLGLLKVGPESSGADPGPACYGLGGAGPGHGFGVAAILHSPRMLVPFGAGVTSAMGFLTAPLAFDFVRSFLSQLDTVDWAHVNGLFEDMAAQGDAILARSGVPAD